jgi:hypothetical protein
MGIGIAGGALSSHTPPACAVSRRQMDLRSARRHKTVGHNRSAPSGQVGVNELLAR